MGTETWFGKTLIRCPECGLLCDFDGYQINQENGLRFSEEVEGLKEDIKTKRLVATELFLFIDNEMQGHQEWEALSKKLGFK